MMDSRRRGGPSRPASVEENACWKHAAESLNQLSNFYAKDNTPDTVARVNRLISAWPVDDTVPSEGLGPLRMLQSKLNTGISEISKTATQEARAIDDVLERVGVLIALRRAPEPALPPEKRKRPRAHSPSGTPVPGSSASRPVSITLLPRTNSVGPSGHPRDSRGKKDSNVKPPALQPGRKVVFRPPKSTDTDEGTWIVAIVTRFIGPDKQGGKYEVQDAEPQDNGLPGMKYTASLKSIVPLPDQDASPGSPAHLNLHTTFPVGSIVLALYPDTSCFYRAEVIAVPSPDRSSPSTKYTPAYSVKFEDDEDMIHSVSAYWVVQFPSHLL